MDKSMSVQIREGHIRKAPSFLSAVAGKLAYGKRVSVLMEEGAWINILSSETGLSGWMHTSALTPKKIILNAGQKDIPLSAASEEYALAGKGFNSDVEKKFHAGNPNLDFTWINRMETFVIGSRQKQNFLISGHIVPKGGVK